MRKLSMIAVCLLVLAGQTNAQNRTGYSGMVNGGALFGSNDTKIQVQTIHGLAYDSWFAGIGGGIDDYFQQSFPVFIDVRKTFLKKIHKPFAYFDAGVNILDKKTETDWEKTELKPGAFLEAGIGYKIQLRNKLYLNLAAGYSNKNHEENTYRKPYSPTPPHQSQDWALMYRDKFRLQRLAVKVGLQF